jgi:hypothetical protein
MLSQHKKGASLNVIRKSAFFLPVSHCGKGGGEILSKEIKRFISNIRENKCQGGKRKSFSLNWCWKNKTALSGGRSEKRQHQREEV